MQAISKSLTVEEKERAVEALTQELYQAHRGFIPRYPWVFVRVVTKEQQIGQIFLPDAHNKTIHEAVVLAVWQPFQERKYINHQYVQIPKQSELNTGDHVLMPHWAGLPVRGYNEQRYRVVKEEGWQASQDGGIFGVVEYDKPDQKPVEVLQSILRDTKPSDMLKEITERFLLVDRTKQSVTLSGN